MDANEGKTVTMEQFMTWLLVKENRERFPFQIPDPADVVESVRTTRKGMVRVVGFDEGHGFYSRHAVARMGSWPNPRNPILTVMKVGRHSVSDISAAKTVCKVITVALSHRFWCLDGV